MSRVHKNERTESDIAFFNKAYDIFNTFLGFCMNDFGYKDTQAYLNVFYKNEDVSKTYGEFLKNMQEMNMIYVFTNHANVINFHSNWIMNTCRDLIINISYAYTIYPNSVYEYDIKKMYIWRALCCYELLIHILNLMTESNLLKVNSTPPLINMINEEIKFLRNYKNKTNKQRSSFIKQFDNNNNIVITQVEQLVTDGNEIIESVDS